MSSGRIVELRNGCVCCSTKGELASALEGLVQKAQHLDAIVVELSGADPGPVMLVCGSTTSSLPWSWTGSFVSYSVSGLGLLEPPGPGAFEAKRAVATADRILLSKGSVRDVSTLEEAVRSLNPAADVRKSIRGKGSFEIDGFFDVGGRNHRPSIPGLGWATPAVTTKWGRLCCALPASVVLDRRKPSGLVHYLWKTEDDRKRSARRVLFD